MYDSCYTHPLHTEDGDKNINRTSREKLVPDGQQRAVTHIAWGRQNLASPLECSWLVTPPPCFINLGSSDAESIESNPLENLLIEHPSMSIYDSKHSREGNKKQSSQVATASPKSAAVRGCISTRMEPYNLRKSTMQKSKKSKNQTTAKAYRKQNKIYNLKNQHFAPRPAVVFQPRK